VIVRGALKSITDLKGLKFRTYNVMTGRIAALAGAIPTQIEVPDIPTAFATGRVEAMITSPATGVDSKAWDFLTHYHDTQAWLPRNMVFVNKAAFDKLTPDQQKALTEAAKAAEERGWKASYEETAIKTKVLQDNGIVVVQPSDALKKGFADIGAKITAEWEQTAGADGKAMLGAYRK
jgi:TRAP-type C4-dicarboxylate transport system substrate-binding protein